MQVRTTGPGRLRVVLVALVAAVVTGALAAPAWADLPGGPTIPGGIQPQLIPGNPDCADFGYPNGFKIDDNPNLATGTEPWVYNLGAGGTQNGLKTEITVGAGAAGQTVTVSTGGSDSAITWSSTIAISAVIMKAGNNANLYVYDPASMGPDGNVHTPTKNNGQPRETSHAEFCWGDVPPPPEGEVKLTKTAFATWERKIKWKLEKTVTPDHLHLFPGDEATVEYAVRVTPDGKTDVYTVSGSVTVTNGLKVAIDLANLTDTITQNPGNVQTTAKLDCPSTTLAAGETAICTYSETVPDGKGGVNTAKFSQSISGDLVTATATADFVFPELPTLVDGTVTAFDKNTTFNPPFVVTSTDGTGAGAVRTYRKTFTCADEGSQKNTATLREGDNDPNGTLLRTTSVTVKVECTPIKVKKTAETKLDRKWTWTIEKRATRDSVELSHPKRKKKGESKTGGEKVDRPPTSAAVYYTVIVRGKAGDTNKRVVGTITIENPNTWRRAVILSVKDVLSPGAIEATILECDGQTPPTPQNPLRIGKGETVTCTYRAYVPDEVEEGENTATVTQENHAYNDPKNPDAKTPIGTTEYTAKAPYTFASAMLRKIDDHVRVTDTSVGLLGEINASRKYVERRFNYRLIFAPNQHAPWCGTGAWKNTATYVTNDTKTTGSAMWVVNTYVLCTDDDGKGSPVGGGTAGTGGAKTPAAPKLSRTIGARAFPPLSKQGIVQLPSIAEDAICVPGAKGNTKLTQPGSRKALWSLIGERGQKTRFFKSGKSWGKALRTGGDNAYYQLAGAYVLAKLNLLNGLPATQEVLKAMRWSERYFEKRKPRATSVKRAIAVKRIGLKKAKMKLIRERTANMSGRATILSKFNRGVYVPTC